MIEPTQIDGIYRTDKYSSCSLVGYLTASYKDLVRLLGEPNSAGDEYKVSTEWVLQTDTGICFTIYDYKETSLYESGMPSVERFRAQKSYEWHIGGPNKGPWFAKTMARLQGALTR